MILSQFLKDHPEIPFQKYIGSKQNMADFQLTNCLTLSVKSQSKVCPARIGQLTKKRFCEEFHLLKNIDLKSYILKNVFRLTFKYYQNLFSFDSILWIYKQKNKFFYLFIDRKNASPYLFDKKEEFFFTRDIENWKESTTIKYKKISIGQYQIHNKRDFGIGYNFKNVLKFWKIFE